MGAPQVIILLLMVQCLIISFKRDGLPQPPYNVKATFLSLIIQMALLTWGGFFR